jgi:predicted nuclease of predicted toxin-antitoxin system
MSVLWGHPAKLLLISSGNISNRDLEALVKPLLPDIIRELQSHSFLELGRTGLVIRS